MTCIASLTPKMHQLLQPLLLCSGNELVQAKSLAENQRLVSEFSISIPHSYLQK